MKIFLTILLLGQILMAATIDTINIKNKNITVIKESDSRLPLVTMQLIFEVSGSIEDGKKPGLAKLSAKMLNEGTKKLGSSEFAKLLEEKAIHISSHNGTETFVIEVSSLKEQFSEALKRLNELLNDPNLTQETLLKVKTKLIGELKSKENDYDYIASVNLKKILFENTSLANPKNGTIESLESITLDDIKDFISSHLVLSRAIVAIGGDVDKKTINEIKPILEDLEVGESKKLSFYEASKKAKTITEKKDTKQAYIYFGSPYNLKYNDKDTYKAKVATFILGSGGFGSRLMEEIRVKKGLAYSAYARVSLNKSASYFSGYLQTKLESQDDAIRTVKNVIDEFIKNGATKEELEQTKKFLLGSEPLRNETMSQRLNRAFMEYYKGFEPGYYKKELKEIENLSLKELNDYIKKHNEIKNLSISIVTK
jgi:predicted Zn-dependent peptidase